jgi:hypothetical protein
MKQYNIKLNEAQLKHLSKKDNASEYIRQLFDNDMGFLSFDHAFSIVERYCNRQHDTPTLAAELAMLLVKKLSGRDVLMTLLEGGTK